MTPTAIKWLLYDMVRNNESVESIADLLAARGASFEDLVAYMVRVQKEQVD